MDFNQGMFPWVTCQLEPPDFWVNFGSQKPKSRLYQGNRTSHLRICELLGDLGCVCAIAHSSGISLLARKV